MLFDIFISLNTNPNTNNPIHNTIIQLKKFFNESFNAIQTSSIMYFSILYPYINTIITKKCLRNDSKSYNIINNEQFKSLFLLISIQTNDIEK